jgi:hypothetical protein
VFQAAMFTAIAVAGVGVIWTSVPNARVSLGSSSVTSSAAPLHTKFELEPKTLKELLTLPAEQLGKVDIARMNLLCATGLRGADALNTDDACAQLNRWAERVRFETERHLHKFRQAPNDYDNSEAYFRALMLITVLQQDLGVHYNPNRIHQVDFTRSEDLFIHGMIPAPGQDTSTTNGGTCVSMPVIYTAVARRLGYPVKLVTTKAHVFCRWDGKDDANLLFQDRFNIEATNQGMLKYPDEHYKSWPMAVGDVEIAENQYLQSMTPRQELALFMVTRGHNLLDTIQPESAMHAYGAACRLAGSPPIYRRFYHSAIDSVAALNAPSRRMAMDYPTPGYRVGGDPSRPPGPPMPWAAGPSHANFQQSWPTAPQMASPSFNPPGSGNDRFRTNRPSPEFLQLGAAPHPGTPSAWDAPQPFQPSFGQIP